MGQLAGIGEGIGTGVGGSDTSAYGLSQGSLSLGTASLFAGVGASIASSVGSYQQAKYAAGVANLNYQNALLAGQSEETKSKMQFGAMGAQAVASAAARGVGVGGESVRATTSTIADLGAIDAGIIHYNAARAAFGFEAERNVAEKEGQNALLLAPARAETAFITGASALSNKALAYKMIGADRVSAPPPTENPTDPLAYLGLNS